MNADKIKPTITCTAVNNFFIVKIDEKEYSISFNEWEKTVKRFQNMAKRKWVWGSSGDVGAGSSVKIISNLLIDSYIQPYLDSGFLPCYLKNGTMTLLSFFFPKSTDLATMSFRFLDPDGNKFDYDRAVNMLKVIDLEDRKKLEQYAQEYYEQEKKQVGSWGIKVKGAKGKAAGFRRKMVGERASNKITNRVDRESGKIVDEINTFGTRISERSEYLFQMYFEVFFSFVNAYYEEVESKIQYGKHAISYQSWDNESGRRLRAVQEKHEHMLDVLLAFKACMYWQENPKICYSDIYKLYFFEFRTWLRPHIENGAFAKHAKACFANSINDFKYITYFKNSPDGNWIVKDMDRVLKTGRQKDANFYMQTEMANSLNKEEGIYEWNNSLEDSLKFIQETIEKGSWMKAEKKKEKMRRFAALRGKDIAQISKGQF